MVEPPCCYSAPELSCPDRWGADRAAHGARTRDKLSVHPQPGTNLNATAENDDASNGENVT
jgi:hypothetical protein